MDPVSEGVLGGIVAACQLNSFRGQKDERVGQMSEFYR